MDTPDTYSHLFWGYAAIWFCITAFLLAVGAAQRKQLRRLEALECELKRLGGLRDSSAGEAVANEKRGA
jgi:hypothetical protein